MINENNKLTINEDTIILGPLGTRDDPIEALIVKNGVILTLTEPIYVKAVILGENVFIYQPEMVHIVGENNIELEL